MKKFTFLLLLIAAISFVPGCNVLEPLEGNDYGSNPGQPQYHYSDRHSGHFH